MQRRVAARPLQFCWWPLPHPGAEAAAEAADEAAARASVARQPSGCSGHDAARPGYQLVLASMGEYLHPCEDSNITAQEFINCWLLKAGYAEKFLS